LLVAFLKCFFGQSKAKRPFLDAVTNDLFLQHMKKGVNQLLGLVVKVNFNYVFVIIYMCKYKFAAGSRPLLQTRPISLLCNSQGEEAIPNCQKRDMGGGVPCCLVTYLIPLILVVDLYPHITQRDRLNNWGNS